MADFNELLNEAEKISVDIDGGGTQSSSALPKVNRSILQVLKASTDLYSKIAKGGTKDIQANLLLGSKGVDLPKIIQKLESVSTNHTFEPAEPHDNVDITSLLESELQNAVFGVFETTRKSISDDICEQTWSHQKGEWKQEKRNILNALVGTSGAFLDIPKPLPVFVMNEPITVAPTLGMDEAQYAHKLVEYNYQFGANEFSNLQLIDSFVQVANNARDLKVKEMWELLKYMIHLPPFPQSEDPITSRNSPKIIIALLRQAKKYLENRYKTFMKNVVNENLQVALLGGVPGTYPLVRSFVGVRFQGVYVGLKDDTIEERPLWPVVYYCLRCGDLRAAVYCLKQKNCSTEFQPIIQLLEAKATNECADVTRLEDTIKLNYRKTVRNETDPFKRIVFAVLGCCDPVDDHTEVARTADDYLWLKLSLVRSEATNNDYIKYSALQRTILEEYGENHYDALNKPHLYFQVLLLTGQFEAAIEILSRTDKYKVHSVHMAIVLNELYMLGLSRDISNPLLSIDPVDEKPSRRLNFARLVMTFIRPFEATCPNEALHYALHLRNFNDANGTNLFTVCVSDLVIESKEYDKILGRIETNGVKSKGLLDQFIECNIDTNSIVLYVGDVLVNNSLFEDAIRVFEVANNHEQVLKLFCKLMSQVVQFSTKENALKERLLDKANQLCNRYQSEGFNASTETVHSYLKLKHLAVFFDQYHSKQYRTAMSTVSDLQLLPGNMSQISDSLKAFSKLSAEMAKMFPDLLLATMTILFEEYQKLKHNRHVIVSKIRTTNAEEELHYYREYAKVLIKFTGLLPYRIPRNISSRLVQMEILMH